MEALSLKLNLTDKDKKVDYNQFELFGYDFMIDMSGKALLIEVNTNPCLDTTPCPLLQRLIPLILDQTFKVCVDPFLQSADSRRQEQDYGALNGAEMALNQF